MTTQSDRIREKLDEIEAELRRIGFWQETTPNQEQMNFAAPFGRDTLTFSQWLQFVFLPLSREMLDQYETLPRASDVSTVAETQYRDQEETAELLKLLREFDALFD